MSIPVFHGDQHGTAIISLAALLNAVRISGRGIRNCRFVVNGAVAAGIACANMKWIYSKGCFDRRGGAFAFRHSEGTLETNCN